MRQAKNGANDATLLRLSFLASHESFIFRTSDISDARDMEIIIIMKAGEHILQHSLFVFYDDHYFYTVH